MTLECKWCSETIKKSGNNWLHVTGVQATKNTCALSPYGKYHAEPEAQMEREIWNEYTQEERVAYVQEYAESLEFVQLAEELLLLKDHPNRFTEYYLDLWYPVLKAEFEKRVA